MLKTRTFWIVLILLIAVPALYFWAMLNWSYSDGERAGWLQKLSRKGWVCKTWEGELSMVAMPGAAPEKFQFTVLDDAVAAKMNEAMGQRVALHYEEKVGLPGSCFGETRYYVTSIRISEQVPLTPSVSVPQVQALPASAPASVPVSQ